ncbi:MAG: hypothetical protein D6743_06510 [Calditrichaeota bacterium]|nr:MAG: hypothetical protein D6743_06510 [Calditrichota bacterium]
MREETADGTELAHRSHHMTFTRYTFSDAHFLPIYADRLIFANRFAFEAIAGDAPYYAFGDFAGERRTHAVGGSQSLRGYQSRRFQDKIKLITLTELRFKYRHFRFMSQTFDLILVAFFDNGRVWHRWADLSFDGFHTTVGAGVWLNWNNGMIIRLDMGHSPEETLIAFLRLRTAF